MAGTVGHGNDVSPENPRACFDTHFHHTVENFQRFGCFRTQFRARWHRNTGAQDQFAQQFEAVGFT